MSAGRLQPFPFLVRVLLLRTSLPAAGLGGASHAAVVGSSASRTSVAPYGSSTTSEASPPTSASAGTGECGGSAAHPVMCPSARPPLPAAHFTAHGRSTNPQRR